MTWNGSSYYLQPTVQKPLIADDQKNRDEMLIYAVAAHNINVSRGTGIAPNEVHIGIYPRLPMTVLEGRGVKAHQGLKQDQLDCLKLMRDRQVRTYELLIVKEEDRLTKATHESNNKNQIESTNRRPKYEAGGWAWIYDDKSTIYDDKSNATRSCNV